MALATPWTLPRRNREVGAAHRLLVIRGFGRYKLHKPMHPSTFELLPDDWRSPIRRGVGLWRYKAIRREWSGDAGSAVSGACDRKPAQLAA